MSDARVLLHDQATRTNPGETDSAGGMNRIAELGFEQPTPGRPRHQDRQEHCQFLQHAGASERYNSRYSEIMRAAENRFAFSSALALQHLRSSGSASRNKSDAKPSSSSGSWSNAPAPATSAI